MNFKDSPPAIPLPDKEIIYHFDPPYTRNVPKKSSCSRQLICGGMFILCMWVFVIGLSLGASSVGSRSPECSCNRTRETANITSASPAITTTPPAAENKEVLGDRPVPYAPNYDRQSGDDNWRRTYNNLPLPPWPWPSPVPYHPQAFGPPPLISLPPRPSMVDNDDHDRLAFEEMHRIFSDVLDDLRWQNGQDKPDEMVDRYPVRSPARNTDDEDLDEFRTLERMRPGWSPEEDDLDEAARPTNNLSRKKNLDDDDDDIDDDDDDESKAFKMPGPSESNLNKSSSIVMSVTGQTYFSSAEDLPNGRHFSRVLQQTTKPPPESSSSITKIRKTTAPPYSTKPIISKEKAQANVKEALRALVYHVRKDQKGKPVGEITGPVTTTLSSAEAATVTPVKLTTPAELNRTGASLKVKREIDSPGVEHYRQSAEIIRTVHDILTEKRKLNSTGEHSPKNSSQIQFDLADGDTFGKKSPSPLTGKFGPRNRRSVLLDDYDDDDDDYDQTKEKRTAYTSRKALSNTDTADEDTREAADAEEKTEETFDDDDDDDDDDYATNNADNQEQQQQQEEQQDVSLDDDDDDDDNDYASGQQQQLDNEGTEEEEKVVVRQKTRKRKQRRQFDLVDADADVRSRRAAKNAKTMQFDVDLPEKSGRERRDAGFMRRYHLKNTNHPPSDNAVAIKLGSINGDNGSV